MPSQQKFASSATLVSGASWTSLSSVLASDGINAQFSHGPDDSGLILVSNFGFTIPAGMTPTGVEVFVRRFKTGGFPRLEDLTVQLYDGSAVGDNKASSESWSAASVLKTYGASDDAWNASLSRDDVNASTFGVLLQTTKNDPSSTVVTANVDVIYVTVHYDDERAPTVQLSAVAQSPVGPFEKPATLSITATAQPLQIERGETVTLTAVASDPVQPPPKSMTLGMSVVAVEPVGPAEKPPTLAMTIVPSALVEVIQKLPATTCVAISLDLADARLVGSTLVATSEINIEALAPSVLVAVGLEIVSPLTTTAVVQSSGLLKESLAPTKWVASSLAIGESEILEATSVVAASQLLPSPLAMTATVAIAPTLSHPIERTFIVATSDRLDESIEVLQPPAIVSIAPALEQPVEPLSAAVSVVTSSLQRPLEATHVVAVSADLVQLPDAPIETTMIVATSDPRRPLTYTPVVAIAPGLVELPGVPLEQINVVALSTQDEPLTTAAVIAVSDDLVQLPDVPTDATTIVATAPAISQPIEALSTTTLVVVSDRLTEATEQLTATSVVGVSSLERPLEATRIGAVAPSLVELPGARLDTTPVVASLPSIMQPIEVLEATSIVAHAERLTETIEVSEQTNLVALSREHGQGYLTKPVVVAVSPALCCC